MNKILIYHHLGLGDAIECNGMVRCYADTFDQVDIFSKDSYYDMISYMYRDDKKIKIHQIDSKNEYQETSKFINSYDGRLLIAGHSEYFQNLSFFESKNFGPGESFYYIAKIPWNFRNSYFHLERNEEQEKRVFKKLNPNNDKFIFIHDDLQRGFKINVNTDLKIIRNDTSENLFFMTKLLEEAEEIHCMSSSMLCYIDCLSSKIAFKNLFLHYNIRKVKLGSNSLFADWKII